MRAAVEHQVLVDLVAHGEGVMALEQIGDEVELVAVEHLGRGIERVVEHEQLGPGRERRRQRLARQAPVGRLEADQLGHAAAPPHDRQIAVVERLEQHHLVARLDEPEQARGQRLGRARGHHHLALPVDSSP